MNLFTVVLFGLVFSASQEKADAVTCYVCGRGSEGCGSSFRSSGSGVATSSVSNAAACTKIVSSVNRNSIARSFITNGGTCTEGANSDDGTNSYQYCCTTDLCNTGSMGKASWLLGIFSALLGLLLIK